MLRSPARQKALQEFCHANKDLLFIIADPTSDHMMMAYKDKMLVSQIKSADGKNYHVVKRILKWSRFASNIDRFLIAVADMMELSITKGNDFYKWIDGGVHAISNSLRKGTNYGNKKA